MTTPLLPTGRFFCTHDHTTHCAVLEPIDDTSFGLCLYTIDQPTPTTFGYAKKVYILNVADTITFAEIDDPDLVCGTAVFNSDTRSLLLEHDIEDPIHLSNFEDTPVDALAGDWDVQVSFDLSEGNEPYSQSISFDIQTSGRFTGEWVSGVYSGNVCGVATSRGIFFEKFFSPDFDQEIPWVACIARFDGIPDQPFDGRWFNLQSRLAGALLFNRTSQ